MLLTATSVISPIEQVSTASTLLLVFASFGLTLLAHVLSRIINRKFSVIPAIIIAILLVIALLKITQWEYNHYYQIAEPVFSHLLGYVTVMLAIPLASLNFTGLPLKKIAKLVLLATSIGALFPMLLAVAFSLSQETVMSFATRSVTAPIGLNIATLIHAPLVMANLAIMISGLLGAFVGRWLVADVDDDRAKGLALGLTSHAFGTVEAWQISPVAGRYATFGLAVNGIVTAIWFPLAYQVWQAWT